MTDESRIRQRRPLRQILVSQGARPAILWEPNWIDYRASRANVDRREGRGDTAAVCPDCRCETDVFPQPHSPRCEAE